MLGNIKCDLNAKVKVKECIFFLMHHLNRLMWPLQTFQVHGSHGVEGTGHFYCNHYPKVKVKSEKGGICECFIGCILVYYYFFSEHQKKNPQRPGLVCILFNPYDVNIFVSKCQLLMKSTLHILQVNLAISKSKGMAKIRAVDR